MNENFFSRRLPRAGQTQAEKDERRAQAMERIRQLLAKGPMPVGPLAADLGLTSSTVYSYLYDMAEDGITRRSGDVYARRPLWELGQETPERLKASGMRPHGAVVVPARQIGMARHWMDVALFGPARGAHA